VGGFRGNDSAFRFFLAKTGSVEREREKEREKERERERLRWEE
jgi:hypothetical protein